MIKRVFFRLFGRKNHFLCCSCDINAGIPVGVANFNAFFKNRNMLKRRFILLLSASAVGCGKSEAVCLPQDRSQSLAAIDSLAVGLGWPEDVDIQPLAGPDLVPSPAALAVAPSAEV